MFGSHKRGPVPRARTPRPHPAPAVRVVGRSCPWLPWLVARSAGGSQALRGREEARTARFGPPYRQHAVLEERCLLESAVVRPGGATEASAALVLRHRRPSFDRAEITLRARSRPDNGHSGEGHKNISGVLSDGGQPPLSVQYRPKICEKTQVKEPVFEHSVGASRSLLSITEWSLEDYDLITAPRFC